MLEEGEIAADFVTEFSHHKHTGVPNETSVLDPTGAIYSPSIEWPEDTESTAALSPAGESHTHPTYAGSPSPSSSLRLLVQRSAILPKSQKLVLFDGYSELQFGRDIAPPNSDTPRVRLKEMEVSKLHTTVYWDQDRLQWSVVDMGSKHGTFIQAAMAPSPTGSGVQGLDEKGVRLSAPRVASMPRTLHHLDRLTIGRTTFVIHIHEDKTPCTSCSPQGDEEIPLFLHRAVDGESESRKRRKLDLSATNSSESTPAGSRDPKKALAMLKRSLLSSKASALTPTGSRSQQYVDRSARRRALFPDHSPATTPSADRSRVASPSASAPTTPPLSAPPPPPAPLSSTNIGHRLLLKQGWQPGTALGEPSSEHLGLVAPLDPPTSIGRAGIGVPARPAMSLFEAQDGDWKDEGRRRRWAEIRGSDDVR